MDIKHNDIKHNDIKHKDIKQLWTLLGLQPLFMSYQTPEFPAEAETGSLTRLVQQTSAGTLGEFSDSRCVSPRVYKGLYRHCHFISSCSFQTSFTENFSDRTNQLQKLFSRMAMFFFFFLACLLAADASASKCTDNVALDKPTKVSSGGHYSTGKYAVDGIPKTCSQTAPSKDPWWQVDLGSQLPVSYVAVNTFNDGRVKWLEGFQVYVGNNPDWPKAKDGTPCGGKQTGLKQGVSRTVTCPKGHWQYVNIELAGEKERLSLCEVQVFAGDSMAKGQKTSQSSTYRGSPNSISSLAVDGNPTTCSGTRKRNNPSWQVELPKKKWVSQVAVTNRKDFFGWLNGFQVFLDDVACGKRQYGLRSEEVRTVTCDQMGTKVSVKQFGKTYLSLCEVEVYGHALDPREE